MSIASPTSPPDINLEALIQSLPACKRCRECRRGCDTLLPKCRQCTKAGVECSFYDHGRDQLLPRSYIAELIGHVEKLHARINPSPAASGPTPQDPAASTPTIKSESGLSETQSPTVLPEHYFAEAAGSYRYLGVDACLVKSPKQKPKELNFPSEEDEDWRISVRQPESKNHELVEVYLEHVHPLYPILDLSARYLAPDLPPDLTEIELFDLYMVYSIGCHVTPLVLSKKARQQKNFGQQNNPAHDDFYQASGRHTYIMTQTQNYRFLAQNFFEAAEVHMEDATADATVEGLRAILLLAVNSLFDPLKGNIGQQLALAARLAIVLGYPNHDLSTQDVNMIHNMHTAIFSLENEIATVLDRPAMFPEPQTELCFDLNRPADYICSLYRLQNRWRKGDASAKQWAYNKLPLLALEMPDMRDKQPNFPPSLRLILHQTHLLINPVWQSAWAVLESVITIDTIHTYLTPHWVYRAATLLIRWDWKDFYPIDMIQLYCNACVVLQTSSWKWKSSAALAASLEDLMQQKRRQTTGGFWDKTNKYQVHDKRPGLPPT